MSTEKALVYISSTSRERIAMKRFGLFHLDEEPNATIVFGTAFTEDDIEDALRKLGIGGSDLQRDLMHHLRNSQQAMSTKTPEQRASERYPGEETMLISIDGEREGFATCIRELVEPRDRLLQELVDALANPHKMSLGTAALAKAKEQFGITPTP